MIPYKSIAVTALAAIVAAGCASYPKQIAELDAARMEVKQAGSDPLAQEAAGMRLKKADEALRVANQAFDQHKPLADVQHLSYLAARHAQIAEAQTAELRSRQDVEKGEAERNRVLLEARSSEAAVAQAKAARARDEAARAKEETDRANANAAQQSARALDSQNQLNAQLNAAADEAARLREELEKLNAKQTDRGMVLTLGDVLFDTGQTVIRPGAMLTIDRLAEFLRTRPTLNVMIEGHTDSVGGDDYNLGLSQRRADAVRSALASRGIAAEHVQSRGLGESYPTASNDNAAGRQQNRRVEIIFSDEKGQFASTAERLSRS